jgi:hypothetical protein
MNPFSPVNQVNPFSTVNQVNPFSSVNQANIFSPVNQANIFSPVNQSNPFSPVNQINIFSSVNQMNPPTHTPFALDQKINKKINDTVNKISIFLLKLQNNLLKKQLFQLKKYIHAIKLMKCKYITQIFNFLSDVNTLLEDMEIFIDFDMFDLDFISQINDIFVNHITKLFPVLYKIKNKK